MIPEQAVSLGAGPGVVLEGALAVPPGASAGVVLCHPHPLYGGDMHNPVVVRAAEVCAERGLATLRFNFRGVGASSGTHGEGRAEQADIRAALAHLSGRLGGGAVGLLGYSFGAAISAHVAASGERLAGLALIAPPLAFAGFERLDPPKAVDGPVLLVAGTRDEYCPREALDRLGTAWPGATVTAIEGADHFFFGRLYPLGEAIAAWAARIGSG